MAYMEASVPLLQNTTLSAHATASTMSLARGSWKGLWRPNWTPPAAASCRARTTTSGACPRTCGPKPPTRSMYSLPSTSVNLEPLADWIYTGYGMVTVSTISWARTLPDCSYIVLDLGVLASILSSAWVISRLLVNGCSSVSVASRAG